MTHVKFLEGFSKLESFCKGFKSNYNPGRAVLAVDSLTTKKSAGESAINTVIQAKTDHDNNINKRKQLFAPLSKRAASIMRVLESSGASEEKLADARGYVQQIRGKSSRKKSMAPPAAQTVPATEASASAPPASGGKTRSNLQLAFVSKADWLAKLISTVTSEPLYLPNEKDLQVASLTAYHQSLKDSIDQVAGSRVNLNKARIERDKILYHDEESLCHIGRAVKKYLRGIYGPNSEHYTQLNSIHFLKPRKTQ